MASRAICNVVFLFIIIATHMYHLHLDHNSMFYLIVLCDFFCLCERFWKLNVRDNQVWPLQRHGKHWKQDTERRQGKQRMDTPETRETLDTRHRTKTNKAKNGHSRDTRNIGHKTQNEDKQSTRINTTQKMKCLLCYSKSSSVNVLSVI